MGEKSCRIIQVFLVVLVVVFTSWDMSTYAEDVDNLLQGIHDRYKASKGLIITYRREVRTKTMSMLGTQVKGDIASGKMYLLEPDLLKVEQQTPREETLVTDGKSLWWIIPEEKKVYQYSTGQFGQELQIISDLWEQPSRLKSRFDIRVQEDKSGNSFLIDMIPSQQWQNVTRIRIEVSKHSELKVLDIINPIGTTTRFYFDRIVPGQGLTKESFRFVVPDGFTLVHQPD